MEPLGTLEPKFAPGITLCIGALSVLLASALLELSRTLAETYRGRWFAGNGRDVFHVGAVAVIGAAMLAAGLPAALAAFAAATVVSIPLVVLDGLPARRAPRLSLLFAITALACAPALFEPGSIVSACNAMARALFR